jgi:hypothetical protein
LAACELMDAGFSTERAWDKSCVEDKNTTAAAIRQTVKAKYLMGRLSQKLLQASERHARR